VEIGVRAAGLNFRDVMNALGMLPGIPEALGSECSGVVLAVGPEVSDLRVGDEVVAFAAESFATHAIAPAHLVVRKPANVGFADAVTVPNAYLTAAHALFTVAGLRAGQTVLVHSAAGGVGLAALRLARRAGAEVIATAGSAEKRAFAAAQGAAHAFDSRSPSFADEVLRVTNGKGVDCVLNALSGELIAAGMRVLRPGGHFLEIGKKGIWTPEDAARHAPAVKYVVVDLGEAIQRDAAAVRGTFVSILRDIAAGDLLPLPVRAFPLAEPVAAFRTMAAARHVGKLVLIPPASEDGQVPVRPDGTYLITGGLGGLGFATARWLVERGARELVLVGRRGPGPDDEARLEQLRAGGARVTALACDVGDRDAVQRLWREVLATRPTLRGVVHAAGTLSDAPFVAQDESRFAAVARSKLEGALHLHEQTARAPLDFFVLFSACGALFGSPGQANYAAANALLDALAASRRVRGLAGTSIAWGAWDEVGMASRMAAAYRERWARLGIKLLAPAKALQGLERAVLAPAPHVAVVALDLGAFRAQATAAVRALLGQPVTAAVAEPAAEAGDPLLAVRAVRGGTRDERLAALRPYVRCEAARVLGFNPAALDTETPLSVLGFDSLMAVQLRNRFESDLSLEMPLIELLAGPTVTQLSNEMAGRLDGSAAVGIPSAASEAAHWEEGSL
jgi:NADPH:quinone reductase-like Zn-dependent oxidoreductase